MPAAPSRVAWHSNSPTDIPARSRGIRSRGTIRSTASIPRARSSSSPMPATKRGIFSSNRASVCCLFLLLYGTGLAMPEPPSIHDRFHAPRGRPKRRLQASGCAPPMASSWLMSTVRRKPSSAPSRPKASVRPRPVPSPRRSPACPPAPRTRSPSSEIEGRARHQATSIDGQPQRRIISLRIS